MFRAPGNVGAVAQLLAADGETFLQLPHIVTLNLQILSVYLHQVVVLGELSYGKFGAESPALGPHVDAIESELLLTITYGKSPFIVGTVLLWIGKR